MSTGSASLLRETYTTCFGNGLLLWREGALVAHSLPGRPAPPPMAAAVSPQSGEDTDIVEVSTGKGLAEMLREYFTGRPVSFPVGLPLAWPRLSPFAAAVFAALAAIPYGETRSYSRLAAAAGYPGAQRAVGTLLSCNPFPIILPCHRVIRADGSPGGYSSGREWKLRLLGMEGFPGNRIESG
ncbi:methylated-DNA--protein-cysteine methyltransferase [bacterium BMS3Abin01]|nr:methylated-DNA--protein-cysteine methyltransferase [bacterium BMS3Abin01]